MLHHAAAATWSCDEDADHHRRLVQRGAQIVDGQRMSKAEIGVVVDGFNVYAGDALDGQFVSKMRKVATSSFAKTYSSAPYGREYGHVKPGARASRGRKVYHPAPGGLERFDRGKSLQLERDVLRLLLTDPSRAACAIHTRKHLSIRKVPHPHSVTILYPGQFTSEQRTNP